ncbi:MAG: extracellular solute-binding protein [Bacillota bacterium]|nr:extracellular solute-binding protein [Bacillota bacterium]
MKKLLILIFSALLIFTMTACTNNAADTSKAKNSDGQTVIRVVTKDDGPSNPESVKYYNTLEKALKRDENLNVKFQLVEVPSGDYSEKLNLMLTGGDIPDLIYFQGGDQQMAQQNLLENLTPYVKNSKYIKNILQPYDKERLKNYPYLLWIKPLDQKTPVIRKDWFDKMTTSQKLMANPTPDNYYAFLKELVTTHPGGDKKPAYGITVAGDIAELDSTFQMAFGINQTWLKNSDGTYVFSKVSNNEKELLTYYHKLYTDGILDPQYITKQWDTKEKAFYDGDTAVISGTNGKVIDLYNGKMTQVNGKQAELVVLPAAKGEYQGFGATDVTKESRGYAISSQSKHKDLVFKVLDYLASPKGQMFDRLGFENEDYKIDNGQIVLTDKYYNEWFARYWEPSEFNIDKPLKTPLLSEPAVKSQDLVKQAYTQDNNFILPDKFVTNWDAMQNLYKEYATDIITGKRPVSDFDKFVQEWNKAGGDELTKYANQKLK